MNKNVKNVLFIGNSFTYFNDMYKMFMSICKLNGHDVNAEQVTYGGYSLNQYLTEEDKYKEIIEKLESKHFEYIILQDQSRKTLDNLEEMIDSVGKFKELINRYNGQIVLYSTWSYRQHSDMLKSTNLPYNEFYKVIREGYQVVGSMHDLDVVNVGSRFKRLHKRVNLLVEDDFHPNVTGSYIVANLFYNYFFDQNNYLYKPAEINQKDLTLVLRELQRKVIKKG